MAEIEHTDSAWELIKYLISEGIKMGFFLMFFMYYISPSYVIYYGVIFVWRGEDTQKDNVQTQDFFFFPFLSSYFEKVGYKMIYELIIKIR